MPWKLEQPMLGSVGSEGIFQQFDSESEAEEYRKQVIRRLDHYVIAKHNGQGPSQKTLQELETDASDARQLKVVPV